VRVPGAERFDYERVEVGSVFLVRLDLPWCPRCSGSHEAHDQDVLDAQPLGRPITDDRGYVTATHVARCPAVEEDILFLVEVRLMEHRPWPKAAP
jgi:hypothetical protein